MVHNFAIKCNVCNCRIRLRYQVSKIKCPISFICPKCKTQISGHLQAGTYDSFKLNNACEIDEDCKEYEYVFELSPDLLIKPISKADNTDIITPFMRFASMFGKKFIDNTKRYLDFLDKWNIEWNELKINLDLCHNEQYELLLSRFTKNNNFVPKEVKSLCQSFPNDIKAIMLTHYQLLIFCNKILPENILKEYCKVKDEIYNFTTQQTQEFKKFTSIFNLQEIKKDERKLLQLIKQFLDIYPQFLPIFNTLEAVNINDFGISTLTFEDIKFFYHDAYEVILEILPKIIGINNIIYRNSLNHFTRGEFDFTLKINSSLKFKRYEELFDKDSKFSWLVTERIQNQVRNSIAHFDYVENPIEQTIHFTNKHKDKEKKVSKSLVDIARDCVYMFYSLINLLEVNYILLQIQTINTKLQKLEEA